MTEYNKHSTQCSYIYNLNHLPKWNVSDENENENERHSENQNENGKKNVVKKTWSRLHKMQKTDKLIEYAESLSDKEDLTTDELNDLILYLKHLLDCKRLQNSKDIVYNAIDSKIENIPNLKFVQENTRRRFTLKKNDNSMSISKQILYRSKTMKKLLKKDQSNTPNSEKITHGA